MPSPPSRAICLKKKKKLVKSPMRRLLIHKKKLLTLANFRCATFPVLKYREKKGGGRNGYNFFPYVFLDPP